MNQIRQALSRFFFKAGSLSNHLGKKAYINPQDFYLDQWYKDLGDETFRLNYDLNENSIVLDVGGYKGQWASDIYARYSCYIHIFEPTPDFVIGIEERFRRNTKILVHRYGLSGQTKDEQIVLSGKGTSVYKTRGQKRSIRLVSAYDFFQLENITYIDLMKINIEGGEYELLEHLLNSGLISSIKNIQVQFHNFVYNATNRMEAIQDRLSLTHLLSYQYRFVWENWQLKMQVPLKG